ncbi:uncharacterized protein LOC143041689 [Oratosquilla oratoria]|uniref:uncharacterized protein LOC143041689 n=1 Tax=Oratosquilla oratoria TaxID=337810 RepID=UPI003F775A87
MATAPVLTISPGALLPLVCYLLLFLQSVSSVSFSQPTRVPGSPELVKADMFPYLFWKPPEGRFYLPSPYPPESVDRYGYYYPDPVSDGAIDAIDWEILPIQIPNDLVSGVKEEEEDDEAPVYKLRAMSPPYPKTLTPQYGRHPGSSEPLPLVYADELFGNKNGVPFQSSSSSSSPQVVQRKVSQTENRYASHRYPHLFQPHPDGQKPAPLIPGKGPVKINYGPEELYDPDYEIILTPGSSGDEAEGNNSTTGDSDGVRQHFEESSPSAVQEFGYFYTINDFSPAIDPYKNSRYDDDQGGGSQVRIPEVHASINQSSGNLGNSYSYNHGSSYTYFSFGGSSNVEENTEAEENPKPEENFEKGPGYSTQVPHWAQFDTQRIHAHTTEFPHITYPTPAQTHHQQTYHYTDQETPHQPHHQITDQETSHQQQQPSQPYYEDVHPRYKLNERHYETLHPYQQQLPPYHSQEPPTSHHQQPPEYHRQPPSQYEQIPSYHQHLPHQPHPQSTHYLQEQQQLTQYPQSPERPQQLPKEHHQPPQDFNPSPEYYQVSTEQPQEHLQYYHQPVEEQQEEPQELAQYYEQLPYHYKNEETHPPPAEHQAGNHEGVEEHQWVSEPQEHHTALFSYIQKTAPHHPKRQGHRRPGRRQDIHHRRQQPYQQQQLHASDFDGIDRLSGYDPLTSLVPGGLIVLGLALAFFYFNYVWYPTPVVTARLAKIVSEVQPVLHDGDDQGRAAAEVYEVFRSLEKDYSTLWSDTCRGRVVCKVHHEFPQLWTVTRATLPIIRSNLPAMLLPSDNERGRAVPEGLNTTHYLEAARLGTFGHDCNKEYESCPLPDIEVKKTLRRLLGIERLVDVD